MTEQRLGETARADANQQPAAEARRSRISKSDRFVAFAFAGADVLIETDALGNIQFATGALGLFGCSANEITGQSILDIIDDGDRHAVREILERPERITRRDARPVSLKSPGGHNARFELACGVFHEFGEHFFFSLCHTEPFWDDRGLPPLESVADALPCDAFASIAEESLVRTRTGDGPSEEMTLLQLSDLDSLRQRTTRSKAAAFLRETVERLRQVAVSENSVGVLGNEEFGVIHHRDAPMDAIAAEIGSWSKSLDPERRGVSVQHATVNLAADGLSDVDALQALAYTLREFAKSGAAGGLSSLENAYGQMLEDTLGRIDAVRTLIARRAYDIAYQPIVRLSDRQIHHYEALIRPEGAGREQSPYKLITFAENVDLISEIDLSMCESVLRAKQHHGRPDEMIAMNVSARSLQCASFNDALLTLLGRYPGSPESMIFEITETYEIDDLQKTNEKLQQLRNRGYRICLDDFGVGAANLKVLDALNIDILKIDGLFIRALNKRREALPLLKATAKLCSDLNIVSIAEYVEDEATAEILARNGVDLAQGFYFGKPEATFPDARPVVQA